MIWVWGHAADFDQWAYAGNKGWDYASLRLVFQSIETCARKTSGGERGSRHYRKRFGCPLSAKSGPRVAKVAFMIKH